MSRQERRAPAPHELQALPDGAQYRTLLLQHESPSRIGLAQVRAVGMASFTETTGDPAEFLYSGHLGQLVGWLNPSQRPISDDVIVDPDFLVSNLSWRESGAWDLGDEPDNYDQELIAMTRWYKDGILFRRGPVVSIGEDSVNVVQSEGGIWFPRTSLSDAWRVK